MKSIDGKKPLTIGILGGGQLAKMLANEAYRLGLNVAIVEKELNSPAGMMTKLDFVGNWNEPSSLDEFIAVSDVVTLESEFISPDTLDYIAKSKPVYPTPVTMRLVQDKLLQKQTFSKSGIAVPLFSEITTKDSLLDFGKENGFPFMLKTRTLGYDGYGNYNIKDSSNIDAAWEKFNTQQERLLMAEEFIYFTKEIAVMVARNKNNEIAVYPCVETIQENNICRKVIAPADIDIDLYKQAQEMAVQAVETIDGIGVFGIEMFVTNDKKIMLNEIAPRPHNSGHYTIELCYCSQYENAIRAILNLPLGSTNMIKPYACMINLLGEQDGSCVPTDINQMLMENNTKLHLYNKNSSRKGRKMGHITTIGDEREEVLKEAEQAFKSFVW